MALGLTSSDAEYINVFMRNRYNFLMTRLNPEIIFGFLKGNTLSEFINKTCLKTMDENMRLRKLLSVVLIRIFCFTGVLSYGKTFIST